MFRCSIFVSNSRPKSVYVHYKQSYNLIKTHTCFFFFFQIFDNIKTKMKKANNFHVAKVQPQCVAQLLLIFRVFQIALKGVRENSSLK